jgi:hypothetical protein
MLNFLLFFVFLIICNSLRSARNYNKFSKVYKNLRFYKFHKHGNMLLANERSKDEFIIFTDWYPYRERLLQKYKISEMDIINFDVWCLVDLHKLYWVIKFHNYFKLNSPHVMGLTF